MRVERLAQVLITTLSQLDANSVAIAGALSASTRIDGRGLRIDTGGVIGTAGDNDLLTLNNLALVVAGDLSGSGISGSYFRVDNGGTFGPIDDVDLLTFNNGSLLVTGQLTASVAMSASLIQCTTLEVGAESIKIGSTTINETELAGLDGITAGTVAASKAVIVDSDKDITGFRNVTATGAFVIGNASMAEADLEQIDGITAGTVAASKAVVVDANKMLLASVTLLLLPFRVPLALTHSVFVSIQVVLLEPQETQTS
jgi:hypothetical protein